jgi:chaperonin cofactor prefoldin
VDLDRLAEIITTSFERVENRLERLEQRMDALEQRMDASEQRVDNLHAEMIERFQAVNDRFATMDLRFDQVISRIDHLGVRQEMLERQFEPFPDLVRELEKSMGSAFTASLKQLEGVQFHLVIVSERLDTISEEMRQRFRTVNERLS